METGTQQEQAREKLYFLEGTGEMAALTRAYDWESSVLGSPETWPQCLRITLSLMLSSKFPMFLWWGPELIQFYNDAYRPSLGHEGKHPKALGQKGAECWPEIWHIIYPLIQQVQTTGEATWSDDQLIPIYRNGGIEDVYWTFGYSPVRDEAGVIRGVWVVCNETTGKMEGVKRLLESEKRFKDLVLEAPIGTCLFTGPNHVIELANQIMIAYWGKGDAVIGKPLTKALPELEGQPFIGILDRIYKSGETYTARSAEARLVVNGRLQTFYFDFTYKPLFDTSGKVYGIMDMAVDVTQEVMTKRALEESEDQLRKALEATELAMWDYDPRTNVLRGDKRLCQWFDLPEDEPVFLPGAFDRIAPRDQERVSQAIATALDARSGGRYDITYSILVPGEPERIVRAKGVTRFNGQGEAYRLNGTLQDITFEALIKKELAEKNNSLEMAIEIAELGVYQADLQTGAVVCSSKIREWFGLNGAKPSLEQMVARVYDDDKKAVTDLLRDADYPNDDTGKDIVFRVVDHADGSLRHLHAIARVKHEGDTPVALRCIMQDVTSQAAARSRMEEMVMARTAELAEANNNLKRSNADLAQFAYIASHDLQEPLRKVSIFSQMLGQSLGDALDERSQTYLDKITRSTRRMTALVKDVLGYSQLNKEQGVFEKVDLNQVLEGIMNDFELLIAQHQARISYSDLPVIDGLQLQMSQLFANLISNALKFRREDREPEISIRSALVPEEEMIYRKLRPELAPYFKIEVSDNGIGFKEEYAEQIFNIFQRLHGKNEYAGTGIGLAICKKIAQNHSGEIYAVGGLENGASFHIILPERQPQLL